MNAKVTRVFSAKIQMFVFTDLYCFSHSIQYKPHPCVAFVQMTEYSLTFETQVLTDSVR